MRKWFFSIIFYVLMSVCLISINPRYSEIIKNEELRLKTLPVIAMLGILLFVIELFAASWIVKTVVNKKLKLVFVAEGMLPYKILVDFLNYLISLMLEFYFVEIYVFKICTYAANFVLCCLIYNFLKKLTTEKKKIYLSLALIFLLLTVI